MKFYQNIDSCLFFEFRNGNLDNNENNSQNSRCVKISSSRKFQYGPWLTSLVEPRRLRKKMKVSAIIFAIIAAATAQDPCYDKCNNKASNVIFLILTFFNTSNKKLKGAF